MDTLYLYYTPEFGELPLRVFPKNRKNIRRKAFARRGLHLRIGFIISISLVILAFQWKTEETEIKPEPENEEVLVLWPAVIKPVRERLEEVPETKAQAITNPEIVEGDSTIVQTDPIIDSTVKQDPFDHVKAFVASSDTIDILTPMRFPHTYPEFPGGEKAFIKYMAKTAKMPWRLRDVIEEETVYVEFVVGTDGSVQDITIQRSPFGELSATVIKALEKCPGWRPGTVNGHPVSVYYNTSVVFRTTMH